MKKICFVTAARSEYGLLKWLMLDIDKCKELKLQLIVTGGHLSYEQGHTVDQIYEDGFSDFYTVDAQLNTSSTAQIAESMGRMCEGFAKAYEALEPDFLVVLGDRYELLPICNTAYVMRIPIIHISGGDITEGAIDNGIRNAITMLAEYHFPGTEASAKNIIRMRGSNKNVWVVGEPGLDSFIREKLLGRYELAELLDMNPEKRWGLMTYHAETCESLEYNLNSVKICLDVVCEQEDLQTIITYANADFGGQQINEYIEQRASEMPEKLKVVPSLGNIKYLSFMKQVCFVLGNSSSGIIEAPFLNIPVINVGNRQKGRYLCGNIYQCALSRESIILALEKISCKDNNIFNDLNYWGDGHTSETILEIIRSQII